jgi:hypothetical protein
MNALDVVSLQTAKDFLKVDFSDDDALITALIFSGVALIEQKTQYRLYQRVEVQGSDGTYNVDLFQTPLNSVTVLTFEGNPVPQVQIKKQPLRTTVEFKSPFGGWPAIGQGFNGNQNGWNGGNGWMFSNFAASLPYFNININCGYNDPTLIPVALLQAVKVLISDWYENRDVQATELTSNVGILIAPYILDPLF